METTESTTLSEFVDDGADGDAADAETDGSPTPASNAKDIQQLIGLFQQLTDQVETLTDDLEQRETAEYSAEEIDSDPTGMFH